MTDKPTCRRLGCNKPAGHTITPQYGGRPFPVCKKDGDEWVAVLNLFDNRGSDGSRMTKGVARV